MLGVDEVSTNLDRNTTLTNRITEIVKHFQIIFLINDPTKIQDSEIGDIIDRIGRAVPSWKLSFGYLKMQVNESLKFLKSIESPRAITLFIIMDFPRNDYSLKKLRNPIEFVIRISPVRTRPKYLMVLSTKNNLS